MNRIMFVDDDRQVLNGLRHALRKQRHRWEVTFAEDGEQALETLHQRPCHIVVSDMRMAGMDGAALLTEVKRAFPTTLRLIFSGYAERQGHVKAISVAHQFLDKPCDVDALVDMLERSLVLHALLADDRTLGLTRGAPSTLPEASWDLAAVGLDAARLDAALHRLDVEHAGLLPRVRALGRLAAVSTWRDAWQTLGLDVLRGLFIMAHALSTLPPADIPAAYLQYSIASATLASRIAAPAHAYEAFVAGLLHDYARLLPVCSPGERPPFTHGEIAASLLLRWGLPSTTAEAVARHDVPRVLRGPEVSPLAAVHVAGSLARECVGADSPFGHVLDEAFVEAAGLAPRMDEWRAMAVEEARRASALRERPQ